VSSPTATSTQRSSAGWALPAFLFGELSESFALDIIPGQSFIQGKKLAAEKKRQSLMNTNLLLNYQIFMKRHTGTRRMKRPNIKIRASTTCFCKIPRSSPKI
jgi:hypothetical protein